MLFNTKTNSLKLTFITTTYEIIIFQGDLQKQNFTTFTETAKKLWNAGGVRRIFSGCMWRTVNVTATVYVANECRIYLSPILVNVNI